MSKTDARSRPKRSRWRQLPKKLGLLAGTLAVLLVVGELAVRLLTDTIPPLTVKDPVIGQHYLPSFRGRVYIPEAEREISLRFNRWGFRGPDWPQQKPPGVRRVAVLGDSMIASLGVDESDTLVCRLEQMLNQSHPQVRWEVLNFGVSGASPAQAMVLYRALASRWDPDIVLSAFFVGNDLADNCSRLSHNPRIYLDLDERGQLQQQPFSASRATLSYYLNRYSRLYVWQKDLVNRARKGVMDRAGMIAPGQWIFCRQLSEDLSYAWRLTDAIHRAFRDEVQCRGAEFAVVVIPSGWQVYPDVFQTILDQVGPLAAQFDPDYPDQRLSSLCSEAGIACLTMTADFRAATPSRSAKVSAEWLFHKGFGHLNERGNRLAAAAVHRFLTRRDPQQLTGRPLVEAARQ